MHKQIKVVFVLAVLTIGMFVGASALFISNAKATFVEGPILQDTTWTPTDSPFVIVSDIIIKPGYTLTIQPGVEVRFGGNFSLIVQGRLIAAGTQQFMIKFTSNRIEPKPGDWQTIRFVSKAAQSTMSYSVVEYAVEGITINGGNVQLNNNEVSKSSKDGLYITGNNIASLTQNTVELNKNGIYFVGNTSGTTMENNIISANSQNGIYLQSGINASIYNVVVFNNTASSNSEGILVFGKVTANITRNSISYNDVGISYENATGLIPVQFNDIYGNTNGMNVSLSQPVNAEHNYWGDETGPYHISANPGGKGNPVQFNGTDLDFIPWLTAPNGYLNAAPVANLLSDKILVQQNQPVAFMGTTSTDDRRVDKYFFNFGDGTNSSWTTLSIFEHTYPSLGTYQASLKVMDDFGAISTNPASVTVTVGTLTPLDVTVTLSRQQIVSNGQVSVTVRAMLGASPVSGASILLFSVPTGTLSPQSGLSDSNGYLASTFMAPNVTSQENVRITARASKSGNADGADFGYVEVVPPLAVLIMTKSTSIESEAASNASVYVTYNSVPVEGATVDLTSINGGTITPQAGTTDTYGFFAFQFKAPQTLTALNVTLTATATKTGYWGGSAQIKMAIAPKQLILTVTAGAQTLEAQGSTNMLAHVTSDGAPVANVTLTVQSNSGGNFSATTGNTDDKGDWSFTFTAPAPAQLTNATITVSANKTGYVNTNSKKSLTVNAAPTSGPAAGFGLPLTTILLILIPIIAVVIVVVLLKTHVISFSKSQEETF